MTETVRLLAPNPSPMTLDGTNTYVVSGPGSIVVIDPGPEHAGHLSSIVDTVRRAGATHAATTDWSPVADIVLTHHHPDHIEGLPRLLTLLAEAGVPGRALASDPDLVPGAQPLADGERVGPLTVLLTPGHTSDSLCLVSESGDLFTGDTVLGRGTTVIDYPNGRLGAYLDTLARLAALVDGGRVTRLLPGHGDLVDDPDSALRTYRTHRHERLDQVRQSLLRQGLSASAALGAEHRTAQVVADVYAPLTREAQPRIWDAAVKSVEAQLDYLMHA
ncbi:MBL fold metallo-hydrolase [Micrococcales bacterium 31B]|nr:MBL fold metallo-hydrolase [Micrococcales bacterium 31B]